MTGLNYDLAGYRNMLRMSTFKRVLVEGKSDKILLKMLFNEILGRFHGIQIDTVENIAFNYAVGNREKVEIICDSILNTKYAERVVGFVDREFREFDFNDQITDLLSSHKIIGRVIWSRGHSIENYYFDLSVLRRPLRTFAVTTYFDHALDLFEQFFVPTMQIACAVGLTGYERGVLNPIKASFDWKVLDIDANSVEVNVHEWEQNLRRLSLQEDTIGGIISSYREWLKKTREADFTVVKRACHGHIGLAVIWSAYAKCVHEVCATTGTSHPQNEARNVLKAEESVRFNACAENWITHVCQNNSEYPVEILQLLGIAQ